MAETYLIENAKVISGGQHSKVPVLVEGDRIVAVGEQAKTSASPDVSPTRSAPRVPRRRSTRPYQKFRSKAVISVEN